MAPTLVEALENLLAHTDGIQLPTTAHIMRDRAAQALAAHREREGRDFDADLSSAKRADHDGERELIERAREALQPFSGLAGFIGSSEPDSAVVSVSARLVRAGCEALTTLSGPQSEEGEG